MNLPTSIVSYLLKDIFWRWREQPGNVLTRFIVAYALVLPSLALLGAFVLMAHNLESRLRRNGIDMLFITEHVPTNSDDLVSLQQHPRLEYLREFGTSFQLLQLFVHAKTDLSKTARVVAYPDSTVPYMLNLITPKNPLIYLSKSLPEGMPIRVEIDHHFFFARVSRPDEMIGKFYQSDVVLLPEGMLPRVEGRGFSRITLFKANYISELASIQKAVQRTTEMDETRWFIRSSLKLLDDLSSLKTKQSQWRFGLAASAGSVLALVLGTLAVLEYQQRAYVIALLRSFGVKRILVYKMQLLENVLVVNIAGFAAYATLIYFQKIFYRSFGSGFGAAELSPEKMSMELWLIFVCINLGALLSTIPVLHVLKKDIGTLLS